MSLRLQRVSRALEPNTSTSARLQRSSRAPILHTPRTPAARLESFRTPSLPLCLQPASRAPELLPPRLHACSAPPELPNSIPLYIHVHAPTSRVQNSIPARLHACT